MELESEGNEGYNKEAAGEADSTSHALLTMIDKLKTRANKRRRADDALQGNAVTNEAWLDSAVSINVKDL